MRAATTLALAPVALLGGYLAVASGSVNASPGETGMAALTLLRDGFIGNPYMVPSGPTAHAAPGTVALVAIAYGTFGGNTEGARIALGLLALLQYAAAGAIVLRRIETAFAGRTRTLALLAAALVLPLYVARATISYRQWDQPTTALLLAILAQVWLDDRPDTPWTRRATQIGLLGGLGSLFAPALPIAASLAAIHLAWRRRDWRLAAATYACVAALMAPWAVRNEIMLGAPIPTRSNLGLELAIGNRDGATGRPDVDGEAGIHPHDDLAAARRLAAIGEVAYMREMGTIATRWIAAHPIRFAELCARRATLLILPPAGRRDPIYRDLWLPVAWAVGVAGVAAAARLALRRRPTLPWLACGYLPLLPGVLTHADPRYAFPSFFVVIAMIAAAADLRGPRTSTTTTGETNG